MEGDRTDRDPRDLSDLTADERVRAYGWRVLLFAGTAAALYAVSRNPSPHLASFELLGYRLVSLLPALAALSLLLAVLLLPPLVRSLWEWHLFERDS